MRMRNYLSGGMAAILVLLFILNVGCDPNESEYEVKISTGEPSNITKTSAALTGVIIDMGPSGVDDHGFTFSEAQNPTVENAAISLGFSKVSGQFSFTLTELKAGTTYYFRAFAQSGDIIYYGDQKMFLTNGLTFPSVTTTKVSDVQNTYFKAVGTITGLGDLPVLHHGFVLPENQEPSNDDIHIDYGAIATTGDFEGVITGLSSGTQYYVRAYIETGLEIYYGNLMVVNTLEEFQVADADANVYNTIDIGDQTWMIENLRVERFNYGTSIPMVIDDNQWSDASGFAYCWFLNDESSYSIPYGALYNWASVNSGSLCPSGWHVPDDADWATLIEYLGGSDVAGGKMKEEGTSHWQSPNTGATNESGFTAVPGSYRSSIGEFFTDESGSIGVWWSSEDSGGDTHSLIKLYANDARIYSENSNTETGNSVRCVKDE